MNVTVVGAGYVGLVTGVGLATIGHHVVCVEINAERVARINRGDPPIHEAGLEAALRDALKAGRFRASTDLADAMVGSQVSIIAVGTPSADGQIDLRDVLAAARQISEQLPRAARPHLVAVKSTVVPGTTDTHVAKLLPADCGLCMNPEFLRQGCAVADFMNPDRIVIGQRDEASGDLLAELYRPFECPKLRTTLRNAELIKYTSNALLATLVSFSNEIARLCESLPGTDVETIMDGLHLDRRLSPAGVTPGILAYLRAGAGYGGSCLPKDVDALRHFGRTRQTPTPLLDAVVEVNAARAGQVIGLLGDIAGRRVAVLGLTFKPDTDDVRSSPALRLIEELGARGASVCVYDPLAVVPGLEVHTEPRAALEGADAAVIATAWAEFAAWDWTVLASVMRRPMIVDGRNALRHVALPPSVIYRPVGVAP